MTDTGSTTRKARTAHTDSGAPDSATAEHSEPGQDRPKPRGKRERIKYLEVADDIRAQITSGQLHPGALLPSEPELVARYNVSRNTARNAIAALRAQGLVTVLHGRGAFVRRANDRPSHTDPRAITRITNADTETETGTDTDAGTAGYVDADTETDQWRPVETPTTYRVNATPTLALTLAVAEHTPLLGTDQLLENTTGRRILHRLYIPLTTTGTDIPALQTALQKALEQASTIGTGHLYSLLADAGHNLTWNEYVTARNPNPDDTNTLHIPDGTPVLTTRRITHGNNHEPLALEETHRSADDTQLAYALTAK